MKLRDRGARAFDDEHTPAIGLRIGASSLLKCHLLAEARSSRIYTLVLASNSSTQQEKLFSLHRILLENWASPSIRSYFATDSTSN